MTVGMGERSSMVVVVVVVVAGDNSGEEILGDGYYGRSQMIG
jgi:hypothetical protein